MASSTSVERILTDADKERIFNRFHTPDSNRTDIRTIAILYKMIVCGDIDIAIQGLNKIIMMDEAQVMSDVSPAQKAYDEERIRKLKESIENLKMCTDNMGLDIREICIGQS